jgi:3-methylfumaryl-CoA hydratase
MDFAGAMMQTELDSLKQWIGNVQTLDDQATLAPLQALAATLDRDDPPPQPGDAVPPCWHWLYFLPLQRASGIGSDGHPKRGGFLPPVPLPRRMWAGSRIVFERPLKAGKLIRRSSRIDDVSVKEGRTGTLVFVRVLHAISDSGGPAITEEQDIVYRAMPLPGEAAPPLKPARTDEQFSRRIVPDPVLLFRYSALTFNGHRIHYDRPYATGEEGYPGLVVHGPLIATLLLDLLRRSRPELRVMSFEFKAVSPLIDTAPFEVCGHLDGGTATLWARGPNGALAMQASAAVEAG